MTFNLRKALVLSSCLIGLSGLPAGAAPALTPMPAQMALEEGAFTLGDATKIHVPAGDAELTSVATWLRDTLKETRGLTLEISEAAPAEGEKAIRLNRIQTLVAEDNEAYHLSVSNDAVTIGAVNRAGAFYGAVTLWQLATPDSAKGAVALPAVSIFDTPRFKWRGLMIDSVRHFQSVEEIKRIIDGMASQKLNVLQWHLTDDQGWRLEIRAYPDLTAKTAFRQESGAAGVDRRALSSPMLPHIISPWCPKSMCPATPPLPSPPILSWARKALPPGKGCRTGAFIPTCTTSRTAPSPLSIRYSMR